MKKIGPVIVIISAMIAIIINVISLLMVREIVKVSSSLIEVDDKNHPYWYFGVLIGASAIQVVLAIFTLKKPRGFSSSVLIVMVGIVLSVLVYTGVKSGWQTYNIIQTSFTGIALSSLLVGFIKK